MGAKRHRLLASVSTLTESSDFGDVDVDDLVCGTQQIDEWGDERQCPHMSQCDRRRKDLSSQGNGRWGENRRVLDVLGRVCLLCAYVPKL